MLKYIAFLRAMNVGGRRLKMDELRACFVQMGFANVETFIASGNVIFDPPEERTETQKAGPIDPESLQTQIQTELQNQLGYPVTTFVRTNHELAQIAQYQAFDAEIMHQAQAFNVAFLAHPLTKEIHNALMGLCTDIDDFHAQGREIYWLCRKKQSESNFSNGLLERTLGQEATLRTINTIVRLVAKYPPD